MKYQITALSLTILLSSILAADTTVTTQSFSCKPKGGVTIDSFFRAIPPDRIGIEASQQGAKPAVLDRKNGYLSLSYQDQSGNTIGYSAALYTSEKKENRIFLIVARTMHYVAQLPYTDGFWIFEYSTGQCTDETDAMFPWKADGSTIILPQIGTDLVRCEKVGDEKGLRELCTTYLWDVREVKFRKKK